MTTIQLNETLYNAVFKTTQGIYAATGKTRLEAHYNAIQEAKNHENTSTKTA